MATRSTAQSEEYSRLNGQLWLYTTALRNFHVGVNVDKTTGMVGFQPTPEQRAVYIFERDELLRRIVQFDAAYGLVEGGDNGR